MNSSKLASEWAVEHPALARGRLLTAAKYLATATALVDRMVGYVDAIDKVTSDEHTVLPLDSVNRAATEYLQLGMEETQRELLHAVHALDLGDGAAVGTPPDSPFKPLHPASRPSETVTEVARDVLTAEVARLRAGGGGWGSGSQEAQRVCAAIEVLMDSTVAGRRR
jgi:hypothetical protein